MGIGFDSRREWADEIYGRNDIGVDDDYLPEEDDFEYDDYSDEEEEEGEE